MGRRFCRVLACLSCLLSSSAIAVEYDVVIYGGTSGGVAAAVQVRRAGKSVVLIEPGKYLGGLTSGGLGATDIGNKAAIGGLSREFYRRIKKHYDSPKAWRQQKKADYRSGRQRAGEDTMWTFEPHVAQKVFEAMIREAGVEVVREERLNRSAGVRVESRRIVSIQMDSGRTFRGRRFIDATYEGDLMAAAGVSFHVGRESNATYQETLNGVQTRHAVKHQMQQGVDPYLKKGDATSGLLPGVHSNSPGKDGDGDHRVQAYNFRMCLTDAPENRIPFDKPANYDPAQFELLLRNFEAGERRIPWLPHGMPNRKTDTNNNYGFSTDFINESYTWAEASYKERDRIFRKHLEYQRGLMWTLANHPRVPKAIRNEVSRWGQSKDEFPDFNGWPHQLYVREARRMVSAYVMSEHNCRGTRAVQDAIGLAAYKMDSHNTQRYVASDGTVRNEGDVQVGGFSPYPIAYRSIVPKLQECENLLVPVCLSASHIAYGSIRMEPVFMVLGQSAATAACQSLDEGLPVQKISVKRLQDQLLKDRQVLRWTGPKSKPRIGIALSKLAGIVLEDAVMDRVGDWSPSSSSPNFVGVCYWHDGDVLKGQKSARFRHRVAKAGNYEVRLAYTPHANRATNVPVTIEYSGTKKQLRVNQRKRPAIDGAFTSLGQFKMAKGETVTITISNSGTDGYVIADAVVLLPK